MSSRNSQTSTSTSFFRGRAFAENPDAQVTVDKLLRDFQDRGLMNKNNSILIKIIYEITLKECVT